MKRMMMVLMLMVSLSLLMACQQAPTKEREKVSPDSPVMDLQPLKILYPKGGEVFNPGDTLIISWQHHASEVGKTVTLNIYLFGADDANRYTKIIQKIVTNLSVGVSSIGPSQGEWAWTIPPSLTSGKYLIQIVEIETDTDENKIHYYIGMTNPIELVSK